LACRLRLQRRTQHDRQHTENESTSSVE